MSFSLHYNDLRQRANFAANKGINLDNAVLEKLFSNLVPQAYIIKKSGMKL